MFCQVWLYSIKITNEMDIIYENMERRRQYYESVFACDGSLLLCTSISNDSPTDAIFAETKSRSADHIDCAVKTRSLDAKTLGWQIECHYEHRCIIALRCLAKAGVRCSVPESHRLSQQRHKTAQGLNWDPAPRRSPLQSCALTFMDE
jgi:hypothetical protein